MSTALDIIKGARWIMGTLNAGDTPSAAEITRDLLFLNSLINNWGIRAVLSSALVNDNFTCTVSQASYQIGTNQAINASKPNKISSAFLRDANGNDSNIEIIDRERYDAHGDKTVKGIPNELYYYPGNTQQVNQAGTMYFYPVPDSAYQIYLNSSKPLTPFTASTDTFTFPVAYERALKYQLAIDLASVYGWEITQGVVMLAKESLDAIIKLNSRQPIATVDLGMSAGKYNILTDGE
jgi:hypothetical protein